MALQLYLVILGCTPAGRHTEQHDVFFGVGHSLSDLLPAMQKFWPGTKLHIDSWRTITNVDGYMIKIVAKTTQSNPDSNKVFFLNLGGYKPNDMEEYHYKLLCVAKEKGDAVKQAKKSAFYKHTGFKGATSHIDDKYGVDVDDIHEIADILPDEIKEQYSIFIENKRVELTEDVLHVGYVKWSSL